MITEQDLRGEMNIEDVLISILNEIKAIQEQVTALEIKISGSATVKPIQGNNNAAQ